MLATGKPVPEVAIECDYSSTPFTGLSTNAQPESPEHHRVDHEKRNL